MDKQHLQSFFSLELDTEGKTSFERKKIDNNVDLILGSMQCYDEPNIFKKIDNSSRIYLFKTSKRKRKGQLNKFCERYLENDNFTIQALSKTEFIRAKLILSKNGGYDLEKTKLTDIEYNGDDLTKFENPKNWRIWQQEIYQMLFKPEIPTIESTKKKDWTIKKPDERHIINIVDPKGKSGKSQFFKYLFVKNQKSIARLGYGSAAQLRSSAVNLGERDIYIIDLPRTKGRNDSELELLSVVEDIKSGIVFNGMYGSGNVLLMKPPHILISSNYLLDYDNLSEDRWRVYQIEPKHYKLGKVNKLFHNQKMKKDKKLLKK